MIFTMLKDLFEGFCFPAPLIQKYANRCLAIYNTLAVYHLYHVRGFIRAFLFPRKTNPKEC